MLSAEGLRSKCSAVRIFTGAAMLSAFDRTRAYISGWLLARRRERWRMSEIAGEEKEGGGNAGRRVREREMGYTRDNVYGVSRRTDPGLNINDGYIGENVVADVFRGEISWERPLK